MEARYPEMLAWLPPSTPTREQTPLRESRSAHSLHRFDMDEMAALHALRARHYERPQVQRSEIQSIMGATGKYQPDFYPKRQRKRVRKVSHLRPQLFPAIADWLLHDCQILCCAGLSADQQCL